MSIANTYGQDEGEHDGQRGRALPRESLPALAGRVVSIREVSEADQKAIEQLLADERVRQHQLRPPPRTSQDVLNWIHLMRRRRAEGTVFCFAVTPTDRPDLIGLGQISIMDGSEDTHWGWLLSPAVWGTGAFVDLARTLAVFAGADLGVTHLTARVNVENVRAAGALVKIGATLRGIDGHTMLWTSDVAAIRDMPLPTSRARRPGS